MSTIELVFRVAISVLCIVFAALVSLLVSRLGIVVAIPLVILLVVFGYAIAPVGALLIGDKAGKVLYSGSSKTVPLPLVSEAETLFKNGQYQDSYERYVLIQEEFPLELSIYKRLFEISATKLNEPESARRIYKKGWMVMNEKQRKTLKHLYEQYVVPSECKKEE